LPTPAELRHGPNAAIVRANPAAVNSAANNTFFRAADNGQQFFVQSVIATRVELVNKVI